MTAIPTQQDPAIAYREQYARLMSDIKNPQQAPYEPQESDLLTLDEVKFYSQRMADLRNKKHKKPFSFQFNEALDKLGCHYAYQTKVYLEKTGDDREWVKSYLPTVLPAHWEVLTRSKHGLSAQARSGLTVMLSGVKEVDEKRWLHLSVSHAKRLPNWSEIVTAKETFLGRDVEGIVKLAARSQWVNLMPFCMHVWCCVDGEVTPDFTHGTGTI